MLEISEIVRAFEGRAPGFGEVANGTSLRLALLERLATSGVVYVPAFYDVEYLPTAASSGSCPPAPPSRGGWPSTRDGPRRVALPEEPARSAGRDGARAATRGDLPRLHPGLPVLPGRHDHPARCASARSDGPGEMVENGLARPASTRSGCSRCPARTTPRSLSSAKGLADRYESEQVSLSLPSTRVDAFNIDLANELSRNGRRTGLTFAPEGGSERMRQVINKMVSEEDLIRTVIAAYTHGLAPGEAVLHVRPAHRDRRGRPADRRARART